MDHAARRANFIRDQLPEEGLFAGHHWRIATKPLMLPGKIARELERLGPILHKFYRASNRLYHESTARKLHPWVSVLLDRGKPKEIISLNRHSRFRNSLPNVIRPDILLTEDSWTITELDNIPGGIGLTAWLNKTYSEAGFEVVGGPRGMPDGFTHIFEGRNNCHIIISEESSTYRPEMNWLCGLLDDRFAVRDSSFTGWFDSDTVYRFFEMFDLDNIKCATLLFANNRLKVTPPPKTFLEEKLLLALLHDPRLKEYWERELGEDSFQFLLEHTPTTWAVEPDPERVDGKIPGLDIADWIEAGDFSQRRRQLVLKVSGFSEFAWGSRGIFVGHDLPKNEWSNVLQNAIEEFHSSPYVIQKFHKPRRLDIHWFNFESEEELPLDGRARLCPYYFAKDSGTDHSTSLGGILATVCPANKKVIHGMPEAVLAPCSVG